MSSQSNDNKVQSTEEVIEGITRDVENELKMQETHNMSHTNDEKPSSSLEEDAVPKDFENSDTEENVESVPDDFIDEIALKDLEGSLSEEELDKRHKEALSLKNKGNDMYKQELYLESISKYTEALKLCPLKYSADRAILYANRAASKSFLDRKSSAVDDCSKAIELNDKYVRAYLRRAKLYEQTDKLDESLEDYKKILEFDPDNKDAREAQIRLPPMINERNEKLKTEMFAKLKDLGNMVLRPFGLSTENFQLQQDPSTGGYSVNFKQTTS